MKGRNTTIWGRPCTYAVRHLWCTVRKSSSIFPMANLYMQLCSVATLGQLSTKSLTGSINIVQLLHSYVPLTWYRQSWRWEDSDRLPNGRWQGLQAGRPLKLAYPSPHRGTITPRVLRPWRNRRGDQNRQLFGSMIHLLLFLSFTLPSHHHTCTAILFIQSMNRISLKNSAIKL